MLPLPYRLAPHVLRGGAEWDGEGSTVVVPRRWMDGEWIASSPSQRIYIYIYIHICMYVSICNHYHTTEGKRRKKKRRRHRVLSFFLKKIYFLLFFCFLLSSSRAAHLVVSDGSYHGGDEVEIEMKKIARAGWGAPKGRRKPQNWRRGRCDGAGFFFFFFDKRKKDAASRVSPHAQQASCASKFFFFL